MTVECTVPESCPTTPIVEVGEPPTLPQPVLLPAAGNGLALAGVAAALVVAGVVARVAAGRRRRVGAVMLERVQL